MTVPVDDPQTLRQILTDTEALLLDFDGPICSVFAGFPARVVANQLRDILAEGGHNELPTDIQAATDPFEILLYAAGLGDHEARYVEAAFSAHELDAIQTATPTPGASDLMSTWKTNGRPLAIVSNNSVRCVKAYLDLHSLNDRVDHVAGRTNFDMTQLKPNPYLVRETAHAVGVSQIGCTLVGDSTSDMEAARAANARSIAYANKPGKIALLISSGASAVTTEISLLSHALRPTEGT